MHTLFQQPQPCEHWILHIVLLEQESVLQLGYRLPSASQKDGLLWAHYLHEGQRFYHQEHFEAQDFRRSDKFFFVQLGKSWLRQQATLGELRPDEKIWNWDIELEEVSQMLDYPPLFRPLSSKARKSLILCSDRVNLRASGQVQGTPALRFENEPACLIRQGLQAQNWSGFWGHCNSFLEDDDAVFELYWTRGRWQKPRILAYLSLHNKRYWFASKTQVLKLTQEITLELSQGPNKLKIGIWPSDFPPQALGDSGLFNLNTSLALELQTGEHKTKLSAGDTLTLYSGHSQ